LTSAFNEVTDASTDITSAFTDVKQSNFEMTSFAVEKRLTSSNLLFVGQSCSLGMTRH
jgi:hypothetical protein